MTLRLIGAVSGMGLVHGVLLDHGWLIAAPGPLRRRYRLLTGTLAACACFLGIGHLLSSIP